MNLRTNTYYIILRPGRDVFRKGIDLLTVLQELSLQGQIKITPHVNNIPQIHELDTSKCHIYWDIYLATTALKKDILEVFRSIREDCQIEIHKVASGNLMEEQKKE